MTIIIAARSKRGKLHTEILKRKDPVMYVFKKMKKITGMMHKTILFLNFVARNPDVMPITTAAGKNPKKLHPEALKKKNPLKYVDERMSQAIQMLNKTLRSHILCKPSASSEVAMVLKKASQEQDRLHKGHLILRAIVQGLYEFLKANYVDNRWSKPLPK